MKDIVLSINNVTLNRLKGNDKDQLVELANNIKIWKNVCDFFPQPYTVEDALSYIDFVNNQNPYQNFAIRYKGRFCGMIGAEPQADVYKFSAAMGYWIGEPFWGKGIASLAVKLLTDYAFDSLGMVRIFSSVFDFNEASKKVLEKNDFKLECIKERAVYKNNTFIDEYSYSLVKKE